MTKEIWAAVIIAIVQIIVAVAVGWKQINVAKALANPEQNQQKQRKNILEEILKYFAKIPLHIIFPLSAAIIGISYNFIKYGFTIINGVYAIVVLGLLFAQLFAWWIMKSIQTFAKLILKHETRLKCHDLMLSGLTDKPCKEDGICKTEV